MDKLIFSNIVQKQLKAPLDLPTPEEADTKKLTSIQRQIESIVHNVHAKLQQKKQPPRIVVRPIPILLPKQSKKPAGGEAQSGAVVMDNASDKTSILPRFNVKSVPRMKVLSDEKEKKRLHYTIPPPKDTNNFVTQQRFEEAKKQHQIFENLLEDQKKLELDRLSITSEINKMRTYLDDIRLRLDSSLKKLQASNVGTQLGKEKKEQKNSRTINQQSRSNKPKAGNKKSL